MVEQHLVSQVVVGLNSTVTRELYTQFILFGKVLSLSWGGIARGGHIRGQGYRAGGRGGKCQLPLKRPCYTYNFKIAECLSLVPHTSLIASGGCARRTVVESL